MGRPDNTGIDPVAISITALKAMRALREAEIAQLDTLINQLIRARRAASPVVLERPPEPPPPKPEPIVVAPPPPEPKVKGKSSKEWYRRDGSEESRITAYIKAAPLGATDGRAIAAATKIPYHVALAVIKEMTQAGIIAHTGARRSSAWHLASNGHV